MSKRSEVLPIIGNCICVRKIAAGSSGIIYQAIRYSHDVTPRLVAVKLIELNKFPFERDVERFLREIETYQGLHGSSIVPILGSYYQPGEYVAIVMQEIHGPTVHQTLVDGPWHLLHSMALFTRLCDALRKLHRQNVIHHDIQTGNVMLEEPLNRDGLKLPHVYLMDFGLAHRNYSETPLSEDDTQVDVAGLAFLMRYILWPTSDMKPDMSRGLTPEFVRVLDDALYHGVYKTIDHFEIALTRAHIFSYHYIKREISRLGRRGVDSEILYFVMRAHDSKVMQRVTTDELADATLETGYDTDAPTQPTVPLLSPLRPSPSQQETKPVPIAKETETQEAEKSVVKDTADEIPVVKPESRAPLFSLNKRQWTLIGLVMFLLVVLGWSATASAPPPILDAPIIGVLNHRVVLFDPVTRGVLHDYSQYSARVYAYSGNGRYLAAERSVIDLQTGKRRRFFSFLSTPYAVALNYDGSIMALHDGSVVTLWEVLTGRHLHTLRGIAVNEVATLLTRAGYDRLRKALIQSYR